MAPPACLERRGRIFKKTRQEKSEEQVRRGERGGQIRKARFLLENRDQMLRFAGPLAGGRKNRRRQKRSPKASAGDEGIGRGEGSESRAET